MPLLKVNDLPSSIPEVADETNFLTIASNGNGYTPLGEFADDQKIKVFDYLYARGLQSLSLPHAALRKKTHRSYIKNKDDRKLHKKFTDTLLIGIVSDLLFANYEELTDDVGVSKTVIKEFSEDDNLWIIDQNPSLLSYTHANQDSRAIMSSILVCPPTRFATLASPHFRVITEDYCQNIAKLLPAFLNSRRLRVGWSAEIAPFVSVCSVNT